VDSAAESEPRTAEVPDDDDPPSSADNPSPSGRAASNQRPTEFGYLVLKVYPWAYVSIDERPRGTVVGVQRFKLPAGQHSLRFEHNGRRLERIIHLPKGESLREEFRAGE
jgi:hypothetical protein